MCSNYSCEFDAIKGLGKAKARSYCLVYKIYVIGLGPDSGGRGWWRKVEEGGGGVCPLTPSPRIRLHMRGFVFHF